MKKKTIAILAVFLGLIIFSGLVSAATIRDNFLRISGFSVNIERTNPEGKDTDSGWRTVTGGAAAVEIVEASQGNDRNRPGLVSTMAPCIKVQAPNQEKQLCYILSIKEGFFRPKTVFYASISNIKGLANYLQSSCKFRNWAPRFRQNLNLSLNFKNANGGTSRTYDLFDTFCTSFTSGSHSTGSDIDTNRLSIKVERIEIA